jgi:hypothetical protein
MTLPYSEPPHCRTGHSRGDRYSPAWEQADTVVALYRAKNGHKTIAKQLGISPRIAREILIERVEWMPGSLRSLSGGPCSRAAAQASKLQGVVKRMRSRVRKCLDKKPPKPNHCIITGAPRGLSNSKYIAWRYKNEPAFKLYSLYRSRMKKMMKGGHQSMRQLKLLGCSLADFKKYIEAQFKKGMDWSNNGIGEGYWNLDHITPCHAFDQTDKSQVRICWHWTNFQPLWSIANIKKGKRIDHTNAQLGLGL